MDVKGEDRMDFSISGSEALISVIAKSETDSHYVI